MNRKTQKLTFASKNPNVSFSGEKPEEESDYVKTAACTVDKISATSNKKSPSFTHSFLLISVCWVILFVITALRIYLTSVISENNAKLTAENQNLTAEKNELETQKNNLAEQIRKWSEKIHRHCKPCESGWLHNQSSCYLIYNAKPPSQRTWEEARENCRGKNSDLAVTVNEDEKTFIGVNSWNTAGVSGYWIGLRVEDGRWKWVDGSNLTESSWMVDAPTNGHCAISVHNQGWKSVNCSDKNAWICKNKALSV